MSDCRERAHLPRARAVVPRRAPGSLALAALAVITVGATVAAAAPGTTPVAPASGRAAASFAPVAPQPAPSHAGAGQLAPAASALQPATSWSAWDSLGGAARGGPDADHRADGTVDLAVRGTDDQLYVRTDSGGTWSAWRGLGGALSADPAVASMNAGRVDVAVRGADGSVYTITGNGGAWGRWTNIGGSVVGAPDLTSGAAGRLDLVAAGTDGAVWHRAYVGGAWQRWERIGGATHAAPTAAAATGSHLDVVALGTDDALWSTSWRSGQGWTAWTSLGGWVSSGPDAGSSGAGQLDVLVRGFDHNLYRRTYRAGAWSGWETVDDSGSFDPATAVRSPAAASLFSTAADGSVRSASTVTIPASGAGNVIVGTATAIMNGHAEPGWPGGPVHYSYAGGHAQVPGPSQGGSGIGLDCSGFTRWVYSIASGHDVLGGGGTNSQLTQAARTAYPVPGDLVFYGSSPTNTHHVGIYIGNGLMINALHTGTDVETDPVTIDRDFLGYWHFSP